MNNIELNNDQIYGVYDIEHWWRHSDKQVIEVTGAAGTGKTTLVRYFIDRIGLSYDEVLFVAYMGKAASQLSRHGLPAKTIHSAIYDYEKEIVRDENGKIVFNEKGNPKKKSVFVKKEKIGKKIKLIVVDEGSQVNEEIGRDLLSYGIPVIVLGDLNQLPPVFGNSIFLKNPDIKLHQIMRQAEGDPIVWLSQQILQGNQLKAGVYGKSSVINKSDITDYAFKNADVVLTGTNRLRYNINTYYREQLKRIVKLEYPHIGEKVICRKNNWSRSIKVDGTDIYLTNGTMGFVETIYQSSFNGKTMTMDFRPDFAKKIFKDITFDYNHMYEVPKPISEDAPLDNLFSFNDKMEYAYGITVHSSQGSQWGNVLYLREQFMRNPEDMKKLDYTAITRASKSLTIVL